MNELSIVFDVESPQQKDSKINIAIAEKPNDNLLFKYIVGSNGTWETIKDFTNEDSIYWEPKKEGKYVIMVQAKEAESNKSFDYVSRAQYVIGEEQQEKLIRNIYLDKTNLTVGDKLNLTVEASRVPAVYRYWIRENNDWELIKDYSADNNLTWSIKDSGEYEILVECKSPDSKNKFDDYQKVVFKVDGTKQLEITDFKVLGGEMLVDNELIFQVDADYDDTRMILYKFIKISQDGSFNCIQDYSTKRMLSFVEKEAGDYKLLCLAKDMYSQKEYDDRAILNYKVKPYKEIIIKSFTTDLSSPQVCDTAVTLKAAVSGGKELLYRFKIDGNYGEDSGYRRDSTYVWKTQKGGEYRIELWVKDVSFQGTYEASSAMNFIVDEQCSDPVVINEVVLDNRNKLVKGEVVNIKVIASGGTELRYSFIEKKAEKIISTIDYGTCNWVNFTGKEQGSFELEVRVKDKYSKREYDSHSIVYLEVFNYMPAVIDYILSPIKEHYIVGEILHFNIITQNTKETLLKYVLCINGQKVEETDFQMDTRYMFTPKCSGAYSLEVYAKNEKSEKEFDCMKEIKLKIQEALPVTNSKISSDKTKISINEGATFIVKSKGGKDVLYQFYLMNKGDWTLVQDYSKKNYYSFIPFSKGTYKVLALTKSSLKKVSYEDYDIFQFVVE
jgi:hypothetical protein